MYIKFCDLHANVVKSRQNLMFSNTKNPLVIHNANVTVNLRLHGTNPQKYRINPPERI